MVRAKCTKYFYILKFSFFSFYRYLYLFHYAINLAIRNAWVLYKRDFYQVWGDRPLDEDPPKPLSLFSFISSIAEFLLAKGQNRRDLGAIRKSKVTSSVPENIRLDRMNHWPISVVDRRSRCTMCAIKGERSEPNTFCEKCNVALCLTKGKSCFKDFHLK